MCPGIDSAEGGSKGDNAGKGCRAGSKTKKGLKSVNEGTYCVNFHVGGCALSPASTIFLIHSFLAGLP